MEIELFVSEKELEEFQEEAPESTGTQEQSSMTSQSQGTVKSLLSADTSPAPELLDGIRKGKIAHILGCTPSLRGGSKTRIVKNRGLQSVTKCCKRPWSLVIRIKPQASKQPSHL